MAELDKLTVTINASVKTAVSNIEKLATAVSGLSDMMNNVKSDSLKEVAENLSSVADAAKTLKGSSAKGIEKIITASKQASQSASQMKQLATNIKSVGSSASGAGRDFENLSRGINSVSVSGEAVNEVKNRFDALPSTLKEVTSNLGKFRSKLADMKILVETKDLKLANDRIKKVREEYEELRKRMQDKISNKSGYVDSKEFQRDSENLEGLINRYNRLIQKKKELSVEGGYKFSTKPIENFSKVIETIERKLGSVSKKFSSFVKNLFHVGSASKSAKKGLDKFALANQQLVKQLGRTVKMLRLMVLRMALRAVIEQITNGFKGLTQYSAEFNSSVSLLWNSLRQLGNSIAAAASPLINALAPALNYVIQLCIKAVNAINQLLSALTGKTTWIKAKELSDSYGASLNNAKSAAKELKKTVLGFDELNQLQENKDSGSGGSSGIDPSQFETESVEKQWKDLAAKIKDIFDKIMDPIKKAWAAMGGFVVEAWKNAFKSVRTLLGDIGSDFLKVWGESKTVDMFKDIFKIVGDIGLVISNIATNLDIAWKKNDTGLSILRTIRDIAATIVGHFKNMADYTVDWSKNLNFTPILEALKNWLESINPVVDAIAGVFEDFYKDVLLPLSKWTLEKGLPELIQVFIDFNNKVDWNKLRDNLKEFWKHLEPFAEKVGEGLIIFVKDITDALANFVNSESFQNFLKSVEEWMDNVSAEDVANGLKKLCGAIIAFESAKLGLKVISGISSTLTFFATNGGIIAGIAVIGSIAAVIAQLSSDIKKYKEAVGEDNLFDALFNGDKAKKQEYAKSKGGNNPYGEGSFTDSISKAKSALEGLRGEYDSGKISLDEYIQKVSSVKDEYGSTSVKLADIGIVVDGAINKIKELDLKGWFNEKVKPWLTKEKWEGELNNVKTSFSTKWGEIESWWKTTALSKWFEDDVKPWFTKDKWNTEIQHIKESLQTKWNSTVEWWKSNGVSKWFNSEVKPWFTKEKWNTEIQHIKDSVEEKWNSTVEWWKSNGVSKWFEEDVKPWFTVQKWSDEIKNIKEAFQNKWKEVEEWWNTSVAGSWFDNNVKPLFSKDKWTLEGIKEGLKSSFEAGIKAMKDVWNDFASWLNDKMQITVKPVNIFGKQVYGGDSFKLFELPTFATGGFPEDGLFMANHNELVGGFNGRTAVANNDQIISGIKQGVYEAVAMAMSTSGGNNGQYINNTIQIDGETIARAVTKGQNRIDRRFNPSMA